MKNRKPSITVIVIGLVLVSSLGSALFMGITEDSNINIAFKGTTPSMTITHPSNVQLDWRQNQFTTTLTWTATTNKDTDGYRIYVDGIVKKTGSWTSGQSISYSVNTQGSIDDMDIQASFYSVDRDEYASISDTVLVDIIGYGVRVTDQADVVLDYNQNQYEVTLSWTPTTSGNPDSFRMYKNGLVVGQGSWISGKTYTYTYNFMTTGDVEDVVIKLTYVALLYNGYAGVNDEAHIEIINAGLHISDHEDVTRDLCLQENLAWVYWMPLTAGGSTYYNIDIDGTNVETGDWTSGTAITYTHELGHIEEEFQITCTLYGTNAVGDSVSVKDTVTVNVIISDAFRLDFDQDGFSDFYETNVFNTDTEDWFDRGDLSWNIGEFTWDDVNDNDWGVVGTTLGHETEFEYAPLELTDYPMDKSIRMEDSDIGWTEIFHDIELGDESDLSVVCFEVMFTQNGKMSVALGPTITDYCLMLEFRDSKIWGDGIDICPFSINVPYEIGLIIDTVNRKYSVSVNNEILVTDLSYYTYEVILWSKFTFIVEGTSSNPCEVHLDSIKAGDHYLFEINGENEGMEERMTKYTGIPGGYNVGPYIVQNQSAFTEPQGLCTSMLNMEYSGLWVDDLGKFTHSSEGYWQDGALFDFITAVDENDASEGGKWKIDDIDISIAILDENGMAFAPEFVNQMNAAHPVDAKFYLQDETENLLDRPGWEFVGDQAVNIIAKLLKMVNPVISVTFSAVWSMGKFLYEQSLPSSSSNPDGEMYHWNYDTGLWGTQAFIGSIMMDHIYGPVNTDSSISYVINYQVEWSRRVLNIKQETYRKNYMVLSQLESVL